MLSKTEDKEKSFITESPLQKSLNNSAKQLQEYNDLMQIQSQKRVVTTAVDPPGMSTTLKLDLSRQLEPEEKITYSTSPLNLINSSLPIYKQAEAFKPELAYKSQIIKAGNKSKHTPASLNLEFIKSAEELGTMREHRDLMTPLKDVKQDQLEPSF